MTFRHIILLIPVLSLISPSAFAQLPQTRITSVFPPGGQQGTVVDITIGGGTDLDEVDQMVFSHPGITAAPKRNEAGHAVANTFSVTIAADVPPGLYDARVRGLFGISNPRGFRVDTLVESSEVEPNNAVEQATPVAFNSVVNARANGGTDVDHYRIPVAAGQTIVIRTEAARIDSPMQPLLQLTGSDGRRLASARRTHSQDAAIVWTAAAADELILRVQDVVYGGGDQFVYRLVVDSRPLVDWVSPPYVVAGAATPATVFGRHLPDGKPTNHQLSGQPVLRTEAIIPAVTGAQATGTDAAAGFADSFLWTGIDGNLVQLGISSRPPVSEATDTPDQFVTAPFEATGAFGERMDEDMFRFDAKKGDVRFIEVCSQRVGSLADPLLIVERATTGGDGVITWNRVAAEDDDKQNPGGADLPTLSDDPVVRLEVPEDGMYRVRLRDRYSATRGDPRLQYRLSVREPNPDFRLVVFDAFPSADGKAPATSGALSLRKGGAAELSVYAYRRDGHNDAITVSADQLPAGLSARPSVIGPGQNATKLIVTAAADAPEQLAPFRIVGTSGEGDAMITREGRAASLIHDSINGLPRTARISHSLIAGVMKDEQPFSILVDPITADRCQDQQLLIPVSIVRRAGFDGKVDLSVFNVPAETDAPAAAIEPGKDSAVLRLYFKENAPIVTTSLLIQGTSSVPYRRNPWQAERAKARVADAEANVKAQQDAATAADAALKNAQQVVVVLTEQSRKLTEDLAALAIQQQALRDKTAEAIARQSEAVLAVIAAQQSLATAKASAATTPEDIAAALVAIDAATSGVEQAGSALDALDVTSTELTKQLAAVMEQAATAQQAKQQAESDAAVKAKDAEAAQLALAEAQKAVEAATAARTAADEALKKAEDASKPNAVNVRAVSEPALIRVHQSPAKLAAAVPENGTIKRGASLDVKVSVTRRNSFTGPLTLSLSLPTDIAGISASAVEVPADKTEGTLTISAAADTPPGDIPNAVIQATTEFNGRTATTDAPIAIRIAD